MRESVSALSGSILQKAPAFAGMIGMVGMCLAAPASAQALFPLQPHPAETAWPTQGWETGEMPSETAALAQPLIETAMARGQGDLMGQTRAVAVIWQGKLVAEAYTEGFGPETKQISWSMAKSITQALVGRAVQLGLIESIDAPMPSPFEAGDPRAAITWRQWLQMTDGLDYNELSDATVNNDVVQMMYGRGKYDVAAYAEKELPQLHPPGEVWNYSSAGFHLIGRAVELSVRSGLQQRLALASNPDAVKSRLGERLFYSDWLKIEFFAPLGIDAQPEFDPSGTFLGGSLVWASARDFAKFGYLYLRDGVWEGERLLPEGWVDFARTRGPADNVNLYGAGWWTTAYGEPLSHVQSAATPPWDAFHAGGFEGQRIWIVPSRDLVIVRLGLMKDTDANKAALYEWLQELTRAFPEVVAAE